MNQNYGPPDLPPHRPSMPAFPQLPKLNIPPKAFLATPIALLLVVGAWSSFYQVEAEEAGVVLRFGKYHNTVDRGLQFKLPFNIDRVYKVPVRRQMKQEFGFGTTGATNRYQAADQNDWQAEREMVTGDLNSALVEWVIQYRIANPRDYLFNVRSPDETLRQASESIMRESVGDRTVDEVLTVGRQEIENESLLKLRALSELYGLGLSIDQVQLKDVNPPRPVQASFNEVNQAQQEREKSINEASGLYNRAVPQARGEAQRRISDAQGFAIQRINEAEGDATRFTALYTEFSKSPEVTKRRLYLETMNQVVPKLGRKIIIDGDAKGILPLLNLNEVSAPR